MGRLVIRTASAGVVDEAFALKLAGGYRHGGPARSEHLREKFLRGADGFPVLAVGRGKEPAGHAFFFQRMQPVAEHRLGDLHRLEVHEGVDELREGTAFEELLAHDAEARAEPGAGTPGR